MGFQGGDDWRSELAPLRRVKGKGRERAEGVRRGERKGGGGRGEGGPAATSSASDAATRKESLCPLRQAATAGGGRRWACRRVPGVSWMVMAGVSSTLMP